MIEAISVGIVGVAVLMWCVGKLGALVAARRELPQGAINSVMDTGETVIPILKRER